MINYYEQAPRLDKTIDQLQQFSNCFYLKLLKKY